MTAVTAQPVRTDTGAAVIAADAVSAPVVAAPSLRRNFLLTLSGNVVYAVCQWGILVVLAKLLSPEMVGQFVLGLAIAAPTFFLANLQLGNVQATDANRQTPFETYLRLRLVTTVAALLVLVSIVVACGYSARGTTVILVIGSAKAFDSISDIFHSLYQQRERMEHVSASLVTNGVASLVGTALAIWWTRDVLWGAAAFAIGSAAALVLYNLPTGSSVWASSAVGIAPLVSLGRSVFRGAWHFRTLAGLARSAIPLGLVGALVTLNSNFPRYFVHAYFGDGLLAIFAALAYITVAGVTFVGALCNAAIPRMARRFAAGDFAGFHRIVVKILAVAAAAGVVGIVTAAIAGRPILTLLYRTEYGNHDRAFVWIMVAAACLYLSSALGYAVTATRAYSMLAFPYAVVSAVTLASCFLLIPPYGLMGAAWAMAVSGVAGIIAAISILVRLTPR